MPANDDSRDDASRSNQLAELRADVRHLQSDVTEIKTEVRAANQRIDALSDKLDKKIDVLRDKIEDIGKSLGSAKLWAVLLVLAVAVQLLYVIAHGLKWL